MSELVLYNSLDPKQVNPEAREILDRLAQSYLVEIEAPTAAITDWFVQIRLPEKPVFAGYYGETLQAAASLVTASLSQSAAA